MMKYILILSLLIAGCAQAQIPGYSGSNGNYWFKNNTFIQGGLTIPAGSNPALASGQLGRSGALYYDSTGTDTGLYVSHGAYWVKVGGATDANIGLSLLAGVAQLGQLRGTSGDPALISTRREIPILPDSVFAGIKLKQQGFENGVELAGYGFIQIHRSDGSAINMSFGNGAGAASTGISFYKGPNPIGAGTSPSLEVGTGYHWSGVGVGGHHFISDMRDSTKYASIEVNGISHTNFVSTSFGGGGITQAGLLGKVGIGPVALAHTDMNGYLDNQKSTYLRDTLMYAKKMFITDSAGFDIMLSARASPYETKIMTVADLSQKIAYGSEYTPTLADVSNTSARTPRITNYTVNGIYVHVEGYATITPTAGSSFTSFSATLPIASAMGLATDLTGSGAATTGSGNISVFVSADTSGDVANINFYSLSTGAHDVYFTFMYKVK